MVDSAKGPIIFDAVEYMPTGDFYEVTTKLHQLYMGVKERASDGITCLAIRAPGGKRNHNIEVGEVVAITIGGVRHELATPGGRYRIRSQEIIRIAEGAFSEDWAAEYFDPRSEKFYGRDAPPPSPPQLAQERRSRPPVEGRLGTWLLGAVAILVLVWWLWR